MRWRREVRAWKRSGLTAKEYADEHGLLASTLTWWRWRLKRDAAKKKVRKKEAVRLVEVYVATEPALNEPSGWEVTSATGHVLRVHSPLSAELAEVVMMALAKAPRS